MPAQKRVAILSSSSTGGNALALIQGSQQPQSPYKIVVAVADRHNAAVLGYAGAAGIRAIHLGKQANVNPPAYEGALVGLLKDYDVDIICLAGFYRILTSMEKFKPWEGSMLNVHPSLKHIPRLQSTCGPGMFGIHVHREVHRLGGVSAGCVVHIVTPQVDGGPVLASRIVGMNPEDTPETLAKRVHNAEVELYPYALKLFCSGRFNLAPGGNIKLPGGQLLPAEGIPMPHLPQPVPA